MGSRLDRGGGMIKQYQEGMQITAPCYVTDMPADVYHSHDSISNTGLKLMMRSPAHYKYSDVKDKSTRFKVTGSALHMACLEPDIFYDTYTLLRSSENRMSSEYKTAKKEYGEEFVLVKPEIEKIEGMAKSLSKSKIYECIDNYNCDKELSGFAIDPETGLMCRHRFDAIIDGIAIDLKTTTDARPHAFSKKILDFGYHIQAAFYAEQYKWITGDDIEKFIFAAIETSAPYAVKIYELDQESIEAGRKKYRQALNEYAQCKASNTWPSYDQEIETIGIPQWALEKDSIDDFIFTDED